MLKVAILGSSGLVGSELVKGFVGTDVSIFELNKTGRSIRGEGNAIEIDLNDSKSLEVLLRKLEVDYVLNAAARYFTAKESVSRTQKFEMLSINALLAKKLDELSTSLKFKLIQFSSDAVFSGKTGSYSESSPTDPIDFYGCTKFLADEFVESAMVLRCSVVGVNNLNPNNLFSWLVARPMKSQIQGYTNQIWNGLTALHLAKIVKGIVLNGAFQSGIIHLVPSGKVNKYQLLSLASEVFNRRDLSIIQSTLQDSIDRSLITWNFRRNEKLWNFAGYIYVPSIHQMIEEYASNLNGSNFVQ